MERALKFVMSSGPDMEARIIGLQDGEEHGFLKDLLGFLSKHRIRLAEADLFGERIRHIAIDLKTGMSYNILLDDRIYKPSELVNRMTVEDFQRGLVTARR